MPLQMCRLLLEDMVMQMQLDQRVGPGDRLHIQSVPHLLPVVRRRLSLQPTFVLQFPVVLHSSPEARARQPRMVRECKRREESIAMDCSFDSLVDAHGLLYGPTFLSSLIAGGRDYEP